jgi:ribosomal protein S18 acetylase RimI-like enzyme
MEDNANKTDAAFGGSAITIDRAHASDRDAAADLLIAQMREHRIDRQREELLQVVTGILADKQRGFLLLARAGAEVVGIAYLATIWSVEHGGRSGWLEELYVIPEYRERGIGQALLTAVMERARELGLVAVDLEVDVEHQRAEALYARFGFRSLPRSRWVKGCT